MRAPAPCRWSSRLPPWRPARPFESVSPSVATPTTPTIGRAGKLTRSFIRTSPSSTRKSRVSGARTSSMSCPKPGMSVATPQSIGFTSRISATSESPGSAPFTATGPVAPLIRSRSISVTRSSSERIWPVKQSFVSKTTVSPGSTSSTGSRSGPNDQITWSRDSRCCTCALRRERLVLDVHALHVAQALRLLEPEEHRQDDADRDPADRDPVRVLDRVRGRELHVLVVEREEEEHRAGRRQHKVEERVELGAPLRPVVPDAAEADEDVDDHDDDHRECRDEREPDERPPLPAEGEREDERDDAHPDDRHVQRLEPRMRPAERRRREPVPGERVEDAGRGVDRRVRGCCDRVADGEGDDDPAGRPEDLAQVPPPVGAPRLGGEVVGAGAQDPG